MDEFRWQCWSCGGEFEDDAGISIDDTDEQQVCSKCWGKISPTARIALGLVFRLVRDTKNSSWPFGPGPSRN